MPRFFSTRVLFFLLASGAAIAGAPPERVVSLDYCADQFVQKLLPRSRILAVSPDATKHFSYMRDDAVGLRQVRPLAEDVLLLQPDFIVRSYGGGPNATAFFERAGVPVLQVPFAGDLDAVRRSISHVAEGLGVVERGSAVIAEMDDRLRRIRRAHEEREALYMTPTGVTSGRGTLVHEMLRAAGFENFETRDGWHPLPLERLVYEQPDVIAAAFFDARTNHPAQWSSMRHPVAKQQMSDRPTVMLQGAWTSCGGWFLLDAIEALAAANPTIAQR